MSIFLMDEEKALQSLKDEVNACFSCSFGKTCTQKVFGEGPLGAQIMSISEAPGAEEDATGRPYQGKCGKFWEGMLRSIGWDRSSLHVCNALCCRPPDNKIPDGFVQLDACKTFLLQRVSIVKPRMILVFGKPAAYSLGILTKDTYNKPIKPRLGIQKEPYWFRDIDGKQRSARVSLFYHPSYLQNKPDGRDFCFQTYGHLSDTKKLFESDLPWDG